MHSDWFLRSLSVLLFSASVGFTQQATAPAAIPTTGFAGLDQYRASHISVFTDDFGQLARYRDADAAVGPPAAGENRVVFYGDSITDLWKLEQSFPNKPYVNRGIGGQTTPQMLVRFRQDVIDLKPTVVMSRACAGLASGRIVVSLPGSEAAVRLAMEKLIIPELSHMVQQAER